MVYKDVTAHPCISGVVWSGVYLLLIVTQSKRKLNDVYFGCFLLAFFFFFVGFTIAVPKKVKAVFEPQHSVHINSSIFKIILIIQYVAALAWVALFWKDIVASSNSVWQAIRQSEIKINYLSEILVNVFPIISAVALYGYLNSPSRLNRVFFVWSLPPLFVAMLTSNRSTWFYVISTFMFVLFFTKRFSNKRIVKWSLLGGAAIIGLFVISSLSKYSNVMRNASLTEKLLNYFETYFVSPPLAFIQWLHSDYSLKNGKCTFRFFTAIAKIFSPEIEVQNTVMPFTKVGNVYTNVYTILHWYSMDFGLWWAYVVQGILGFMFGKLYTLVKRTNAPKRFHVLLLSMLMSVLLGEFFCDTFMTHLSSWIQRFFWAYLLCRIIIVDEYCTEPKRRKSIRFRFLK